jgi:hypothetical protein
MNAQVDWNPLIPDMDGGRLERNFKCEKKVHTMNDLSSLLSINLQASEIN